MNNEFMTVLSREDLKKMLKFLERKKDNLVLKVYNGKIGNSLEIKTQSDFNKTNGSKEGWKDITDVGSW